MWRDDNGVILDYEGGDNETEQMWWSGDDRGEPGPRQMWPWRGGNMERERKNLTIY
jgi:hypothetical protein